MNGGACLPRGSSLDRRVGVRRWAGDFRVKERDTKSIGVDGFSVMVKGRVSLVTPSQLGKVTTGPTFLHTVFV